MSSSNYPGVYQLYDSCVITPNPTPCAQRLSVRPRFAIPQLSRGVDNEESNLSPRAWTDYVIDPLTFDTMLSLDQLTINGVVRGSITPASHDPALERRLLLRFWDTRPWGRIGVILSQPQPPSQVTFARSHTY